MEYLYSYTDEKGTIIDVYMDYDGSIVEYVSEDNYAT